MSVLRWDFPSFFAACRWFDRRLTTGGKTCAIVLLIGSFPSLQSATSLAQLFAMFVALIAVSAVVNFLYWPRLGVRLDAVPAVNCGDQVAVTVHLANRHWLTAYDLELKVAPEPNFWQVSASSFAVAIQRAAEESYSVILLPRRRGVFSWPPLEVTSTFPFHLWRASSIVNAAGELVVYPARPPYLHLPLDRWLAGITADRAESLPRIGDSSDYLGNREYRPGMRVRRWDYRSWARLNRPIIREYEEAQRKSVVLFLDIFVPSADVGVEPSGHFEAVLSAAAAVIDACAWHGLTLEQLILGDQAIPETAAVGVAQTAGLESLARATPASDQDFSAMPRAVRLSRACGFAIVVLSRWDSRREELCGELRNRGGPWLGLLIVEDNEPLATDLPDEVILLRSPTLEPLVGGRPA